MHGGLPWGKPTDFVHSDDGKLSYRTAKKWLYYNTFSAFFILTECVHTLLCTHMRMTYNARLFMFGAAGVLAALSLFLAPSAAFADTVPTVSTVQLVPQAATCAAPTVLSATPYVYDGAVNSFDIVLSDSSYVALGGTVGKDFTIPLQYINRRVDQSGNVTTHVDTPSIPVYGTFPISVTMLSAQAGKGICATTVTFTLQGPAAPVAPPTAFQPTTPTAPVEPTSTQSSATPTPTSSVPSTTAAATVSVSVVGGPVMSFSDTLTRICSTGQGALQLWLTLLTIYFVFIVAIVLSDVPSIKRSALASSAMVLVPLLALFALWYAAPDCRTSAWVGLVACLIAAGGLVALLQDRREVPQLPPAGPTPAKTPAAPVTPAAPTTAAKPVEPVAASTVPMKMPEPPAKPVVVSTAAATPASPAKSA